MTVWLITDSVLFMCVHDDLFPMLVQHALLRQKLQKETGGRPERICHALLPDDLALPRPPQFHSLHTGFLQVHNVPSLGSMRHTLG